MGRVRFPSTAKVYIPMTHIILCITQYLRELGRYLIFTSDLTCNYR